MRTHLSRALQLLFLITLVPLFGPRLLKAQEGYGQPYRPQVHFSPKQHWTNDPNGPVFFDGEYHLFFQFNPFGNEWGHMSWGHAVSRDLLHWEELPVAIPEQNGIMIFTGSVVVDHANTSGLCQGREACLIAIFTGDSDPPGGHRETQNLAYSRDKGRSWTWYTANPVLDLGMADFRDPSVFWSELAQQWIMSVSLPKEHKIRFYSSSNLKAWKPASDFGPAGDTGGDWECPDLLEVPSASGKADKMWALKIGLNPGAPQGGSGEQYFLGNFDGKRFEPSRKPGAYSWTNFGKDDYCAISFNGLPAGRKPVLLGWMSNWQYAAKLPTSPWRGQMSLPRELSFIDDADGLALVQRPIISPLHESRTPMLIQAGNAPQTQTVEIPQVPFELRLEFSKSTADLFGVRLFSDEQHWTEIAFDRRKGIFYIDRTRSSIPVAADFPACTTAPLVPGRPYDVQIVTDRSSIEAFAQSGTVAMTTLVYPATPIHRITFFTGSGKPLVAKGQLWTLRSIW